MRAGRDFVPGHKVLLSLRAHVTGLSSEDHEMVKGERMGTRRGTRACSVGAGQGCTEQRGPTSRTLQWLGSYEPRVHEPCHLLEVGLRRREVHAHTCRTGTHSGHTGRQLTPAPASGS